MPCGNWRWALGRLSGIEVEEGIVGFGVKEVSESQLCPPPVQTVRELLENPVQPINDMSYFGCLDSVMENSKVSAASAAQE